MSLVQEWNWPSSVEDGFSYVGFSSLFSRRVFIVLCQKKHIIEVLDIAFCSIIYRGIKMENKGIPLKEKLIQIESDEYKVSGSMNAFEIAQEMMKYMGDIDSELRDNLIYSTFAEWIGHGEFTENQLSELLHISLDEQHLFYGIGEKDTDSVFTRTFSVLIIPLIMGKDREQPFLSKEEVMFTKKKLMKYMELEQDLRGYVEEMGWAHSLPRMHPMHFKLLRNLSIWKV